MKPMHRLLPSGAVALTTVLATLALSPPALAGPQSAPLYWCRPDSAPSAERGVVVWTEDGQVVVAALRLHGRLPDWLHRQGASEWRWSLDLAPGVAGDGPNFTLVVPGTRLQLNCLPTYED